MKKLVMVLTTLCIFFQSTSPVFAGELYHETEQLTDLEYFDVDTVAVNRSSFVDGTDQYGKKHSCNLHQSDRGTDCYIEYYLDGQYTGLEGTLYLVKWALEDVSEDDIAMAGFSVYGDDRLLMKSSGFNKKTKPEKISVDITGVEFLKIRFDNAAYTDYSILVGKPILAFGEPLLIK